MEISFAAFLAVIPSAVIGIIVWRFEKKVEKSMKRQEERELVRQENQVLLCQAVGASIALGEVTAQALKEGHTNGTLEKTLAYASEIKEAQNAFLSKQAAKVIV